MQLISPTPDFCPRRTGTAKALPPALLPPSSRELRYHWTTHAGSGPIFPPASPACRPTSTFTSQMGLLATAQAQSREHLDTQISYSHDFPSERGIGHPCTSCHPPYGTRVTRVPSSRSQGAAPGAGGQLRAKQGGAAPREGEVRGRN